ncbi:MAG: hypothetical protein KY476_22225, partial [Planctomycetes bacterium]|nr:hypothetical protein [Planctomycetota bacterium]
MPKLTWKTGCLLLAAGMLVAVGGLRASAEDTAPVEPEAIPPAGIEPTGDVEVTVGDGLDLPTYYMEGSEYTETSGSDL